MANPLELRQGQASSSTTTPHTLCSLVRPSTILSTVFCTRTDHAGVVPSPPRRAPLLDLRSGVQRPRRPSKRCARASGTMTHGSVHSCVRDRNGGLPGVSGAFSASFPSFRGLHAAYAFLSSSPTCGGSSAWSKRGTQDSGWSRSSILRSRDKRRGGRRRC